VYISKIYIKSSTFYTWYGPERRCGSAAAERASLLAGTADRCSRWMAGAQRQTDSGWQSAAAMARREASAPSFSSPARR